MTDGGETWEAIRNGLMDSNSFDLVLRHSFVKKENRLAFGANNGNLYLSHDSGHSWNLVSNILAMVNYLTFV